MCLINGLLNKKNILQHWQYTKKKNPKDFGNS